jgi:peroxiredoxin Q/BCP
MRTKAFAAAIAVIAVVCGSVARAELKAGDAAPDFKLQGSDGKTYQLSEMKGKHVVVAWFPKAFTGG